MGLGLGSRLSKAPENPRRSTGGNGFISTSQHPTSWRRRSTPRQGTTRERNDIPQAFGPPLVARHFEPPPEARHGAKQDTERGNSHGAKSKPLRWNLLKCPLVKHRTLKGTWEPTEAPWLQSWLLTAKPPRSRGHRARPGKSSRMKGH